MLLFIRNVIIILDSQKRKADEPPTKQPQKKKRGGGTPVARFTNLKQAYLQKRCVIPIRNEGNELCCAAAIIMALERYGETLGEYNKYQRYRNANKASRPSNVEKFTTAARHLHELAGKNIFFSLLILFCLHYKTDL